MRFLSGSYPGFKGTLVTLPYGCPYIDTLGPKYILFRYMDPETPNPYRALAVTLKGSLLGTWTLGTLLRGSWDLVTKVISKVTILITPITVLRTLLSPMILQVGKPNHTFPETLNLEPYSLH